VSTLAKVIARQAENLRKSDSGWGWR